MFQLSNKYCNYCKDRPPAPKKNKPHARTLKGSLIINAASVYTVMNLYQ